MTFWDHVDVSPKSSPFKGALALYADLLNSKTPFAGKKIDLYSYEYTASVHDISNFALLRYNNQHSLAGINNSGLNERVLFRQESEIWVSADCGNEFFWKTLLQEPEARLSEIASTQSAGGLIAYAGLFNFSFGHFILECLPRLWLTRKVLENTDSIIYVNVFGGQGQESDPSDWIYKSPNYMPYLTALHMESLVKVVPANGIKGAICKVVAPTISLTQTGLHISDTCRHAWSDINKRMSSNIEHSNPKRIYLSRSKVKSPFLGRQLINEKEVEEVFTRHGFTIISSESLRENHGAADAEHYKHAHLRDAEIIAGTAGSNLLNHVFCRPNCKIVILTNYFVISHQRSGAFTHSLYLADYLDQEILSYVEPSVEPLWKCDTTNLSRFLSQAL